MSPALAGRFFTPEPPGKPNYLPLSFILEKTDHSDIILQLYLFHQGHRQAKCTSCSFTGMYTVNKHANISKHMKDTKAEWYPGLFVCFAALWWPPTGTAGLHHEYLSTLAVSVHSFWRLSHVSTSTHFEFLVASSAMITRWWAEMSPFFLYASPTGEIMPLITLYFPGVKNQTSCKV